MSDIIAKLREKANNLPLLPGVYIMKDEHSEVIYVGKAKKLKNRVTSYFRGEHLPKVEAMVRKVADFDVIIAGSEFEALVLENSLIKRHMPHYNILLRDDKGYPFIKLDIKSEYPRFSVVGKMANDGAKYFGPFGSRSATFDIIDTLNKALMLPTCGKKFPRDIGKERPCLNHHMGTCRGYCLKDVSSEEYRDAIHSAQMILSGKVAELVSQLEKEMLRLSDEMRFELAAEYRDKIRAIENLANKQKVIATAYADTDAIGFFRGARTCFSILHYKDGSLAGKNYEIMDDPLEDDETALSNFLMQYYGTRGAWAKTILLPFEIEDREELQLFISEASGHKVHIEVPQRGDKVKITESANINAREEVQRSVSATQRRNKTLEWLQRTLNLQSLPRRIEAFDISNTGNFGIVAAMVVFVDGKPLKRDYRRFKIKETTTQDDYASMHEAVRRRFIRCINGDEGFEEVPDLLLIDGGENHAAVAENALREIGLSLPVFGMVKDDRHRTRALTTGDGYEIGIVGNQAAFSFIGSIQEEVHRYAIDYHRSLRAGTISSKLDSIPGIGEKRRNDLIKEFKTLKAIKNADLQALRRVLPDKAAESVYEFFHERKDDECELSQELPEAEE